MSNRNPTSYVMNRIDAVAAMKRCIFSELVTNSDEYFSEMLRVQFEVDSDDHRINAYAGHYPDGTPGVVLLQGLLNWASLLTHVVIALDRGESISKCRRMLRWCAEAGLEPVITAETVCRFEDKFGIVSNGYDCEVQRSVGIAIITGILAHESGHICLHHAGYQKNSRTVHRNEERSADLFAASILASGGTSQRDILACLITLIGFWHLRLVEQRAEKKEKKTRSERKAEKKMEEIDKGWETHPHPVERIKLFLKSFDAYFKDSSVTPRMILQLAEL